MQRKLESKGKRWGIKCWRDEESAGEGGGEEEDGENRREEQRRSPRETVHENVFEGKGEKFKVWTYI